MKKLIGQIIKFGMVGIICFFIDYGVMIFLKEILGVNYLLSSGISFSISVIINYILNMKYVFVSEPGRNKLVEFVIYLFLSVIGLGINQLVMWIGVDKLGINYMFVKIGATAIVMVYNFITRKLFLEKKEKSE